MKLFTHGIGAMLRRAWDSTLRAAEAMGASPIEDLIDRVDRLEREVAALKERPQGAIAVAVKDTQTQRLPATADQLVD